MALKTLQRKYDELLKVFEDVGVKLNESQKDSLDTFMIDFQNKLTETRDNAIKATKRIVEERMDKEYRKVFESVIGHQKDVLEKAGRIDLARMQSVLTEAIDQYLSEYVKEVLPKKTIIDYKRMQKLEQIHESLKDMLLVNEDSVEKKVAQVESELRSRKVDESNELEQKLDKCMKELAESRKLGRLYSDKCRSYAKKELIDEKTKNLPIVESKRLRKRLEKLTVEEIDTQYKTILESVQKEVSDERDSIQEEKNLEEAIKDILSEKDSDKTGDEGGNVAKASQGDKIEEPGAKPTSDDEDDAEQASSPEEDDEGSVQVTESMMQTWIDCLARITPRN